MFGSCVLRGREFAPARFIAPMAGYTHSAYRRLLVELGGWGACWTEMLAARQILKEDFATSPWVRRRPEERNLIYQLMVRDGDPLDRILDRMGEQGVEAIDLNLACDAFSIRACEAGSALFENLPALERVLGALRRHWPGLLLAKIRLGSRRPDWEPRFGERLRLLEAQGVDAVTLHPRFFEDKFRRRARHELLPWVASLTRLPLIANGDLHGPETVVERGAVLSVAAAVMVGRMAVARPWLFAAWEGATVVDAAAIWRRMAAYITEDFPPLTALRRVQMFTKYYAANFAFGHRWAVEVGNAPTLEGATEVTEAFFAGGPGLLGRPVVAGL